MVLEARPAVPWHKGSAALLLLGAETFAGVGGDVGGSAGCTVVAIGDDLTDEDTFVALREAEAAGHCAAAVTIIVAEGETLGGPGGGEDGGEGLARMPRPTAAGFWLRGPDEVTSFLEALLAGSAAGAAAAARV